MAYSDLFFITLGSIVIGYWGTVKIKKIRAAFKDAAENAQGHNKTDETTQPNYWVKRLDDVLLPPKKNQRSDLSSKKTDSSAETPPTP